MKLNSADINNVKLGNTAISKIYMGSSLSWQAYQTLMDIFATAPVYDTDGWYFKDSTGNNNDCLLYSKIYSGVGAQYQISLTTPIIIDYSTDGIKMEFIIGLCSGKTSSQLLISDIAGRIDVKTTEFVITIPTSTSYYGVHFNNIPTTADNSLSRYRVSTLNNILKVEKTTVDDDDYSSAISQTFDLAAITNITTFSVKGFAVYEGAIAYAKFNTDIFDFTTNGTWGYIFSQTSSNKLDIFSITMFDLYQKQYIPGANGYTRFYYYSASYFRYAIIPYLNGNSQINTLISNLGSITDYAYEEFPSGKFGRGFGIKIPSNLLPYDSGNVFFDSGNNAKILTSLELPNVVNNYFYYNRISGLSLKLYDKQKISTKYNTIGKRMLLIGDSTAGSSWYKMYPDISGIVRFDNVSAGGITSAILSGVQTTVQSDPTYLSDKDIIGITCTFNDYTHNHSIATIYSDYLALVDYIKTQAPNSLIICLGIYNFVSPDYNPNEDPDQPNGNGATYNNIRNAQQSIAQLKGVEYLSMNECGLIHATDYPDNIHVYTVSGGFKMMKHFFNFIESLQI